MTVAHSNILLRLIGHVFRQVGQQHSHGEANILCWVMETVSKLCEVHFAVMVGIHTHHDVLNLFSSDLKQHGILNTYFALALSSVSVITSTNLFVNHNIIGDLHNLILLYCALKYNVINMNHEGPLTSLYFLMCPLLYWFFFS